MVVTEKQISIKNELQAIYEEYYTSVNQIILLEKSLKVLIEYADENNGTYNLNEFIKEKKYKKKNK